MISVGDILQKLNRPVLSVDPNATVLAALTKLKGTDLGAILVLDKGRLVGLFAERDLMERVVLQEKDPSKTLVSEVMTTKVFVVEPTMTAEKCLRLMNNTDVRHLPIVDKRSVLGFVSVLDLIHPVLEEKIRLINQLEKYVSETWPL